MSNNRNARKSNCTYEPHLALQGTAISPKTEWSPHFSGWSFIQVKDGSGYFLQSQLNRELSIGSVVLLGPGTRGIFRASQLCEMSLSFFSIVPSRLSGLMTLGEQRFLDSAAARKESGLQFFAARSPVALQMEELVLSPDRQNLSFRLRQLQILTLAFGSQIGHAPSHAEFSDARRRLELFLQQTPTDQLLQMNFTDLARLTNCTSRHLSRLFQKLVGMSFNDKRSELRLSRAVDLLASSNLKVLDVALESGFKSLSQFNQVFTRQFGISPGRWRQKNGGDGLEPGARKLKRFALSKKNALVFQLNTPAKTPANSLIGESLAIK